MGTLTDRDKGILKLSVAPYKYAATRERQAFEDFQMSAVHYWQEVNRLADLPGAYAWDPHLVGRLRAVRHGRTEARLVRRLP